MAIIGYVGAAQTTGAGGWHPLSIKEQAYWGATHVAIITFEDIPAAMATATAATLGITDLVGLSGQLLQCVLARLVTPFANAALAAQNSTTIDIGDNGTANNHLLATQVNLNGAYVVMTGGNSGGAPILYTAANILQCTLSAPGAGQSLSNLTQGELRAYFRLNDNNLPG